MSARTAGHKARRSLTDSLHQHSRHYKRLRLLRAYAPPDDQSPPALLGLLGEADRYVNAGLTGGIQRLWLRFQSWLLIDGVAGALRHPAMMSFCCYKWSPHDTVRGQGACTLGISPGIISKMLQPECLPLAGGGMGFAGSAVYPGIRKCMRQCHCRSRKR